MTAERRVIAWWRLRLAWPSTRKSCELLFLSALLVLALPVSTAGAETIARTQPQAQSSESLADLLARKATAAELFAHPEWIEAERLADARAEVETADTKQRPEAKAKRGAAFSPVALMQGSVENLAPKPISSV